MTGELKFNMSSGIRSVYEIGIYETTWQKPLYKVSLKINIFYFESTFD